MKKQAKTYPFDDPKRSLAVQARIVKHGYIPWITIPGITLEMLEEFADELDKKVKETSV